MTVSRTPTTARGADYANARTRNGPSERFPQGAPLQWSCRGAEDRNHAWRRGTGTPASGPRADTSEDDGAWLRRWHGCPSSSPWGPEHRPPSRWGTPNRRHPRLRPCRSPSCLRSRRRWTRAPRRRPGRRSPPLSLSRGQRWPLLSPTRRWHRPRSHSSPCSQRQPRPRSPHRVLHPSRPRPSRAPPSRPHGDDRGPSAALSDPHKRGGSRTPPRTEGRRRDRRSGPGHSRAGRPARNSAGVPHPRAATARNRGRAVDPHVASAPPQPRTGHPAGRAAARRCAAAGTTAPAGERAAQPGACERGRRDRPDPPRRAPRPRGPAADAVASPLPRPRCRAHLPAGHDATRPARRPEFHRRCRVYAATAETLAQLQSEIAPGRRHRAEAVARGMRDDKRAPSRRTRPGNGGASAVAGSNSFSAGGLAVLALPLGLRPPLIQRRRARGPRGRHPVPFVAPLERPG
jgi:hypothetical protein